MPSVRRRSTGDYLRSLQLIFFGAAILYFGRTMFIPLSFAVLISFILYPVCTWLEKRKFSRLGAALAAISALMLLVIALLGLMVQQAFTFMKEWPRIRVKLVEATEDFSNFIFSTFNFNKQQQEKWLGDLFGQSGGDIFAFLRETIAAGAFSTVLLILVPIFAVLILYSRGRLVKSMYRLFPVENRVDIRKILELTIKAYHNFIKGMAIVYAVVGTLNSIGLLLLGVPHAIFFGFVAAVLTFIPYVGIMVGSLLPIAMSWITYNSIWYPIGVVLIFSFVQYLEANVIFPLAVSNRLKINALATLVVILLGGILWGVAGMILFVPFLAIAKLIADKYPGLKTWSILLGTSDKNYPNDHSIV